MLFGFIRFQEVKTGILRYEMRSLYSYLYIVNIV